jgi:hypothetical protein
VPLTGIISLEAGDSLRVFFKVLIILVFLPLTGQAANFSVLRSFELGGEPYSVAVIAPEMRFGNVGDIVTDKEYELAEIFWQTALSWYYRELRRYWPEKREFISRLQVKQRRYDGRYSMIIVFKNNDMRQIVGLLSAAWPTEKSPQLPGEKDLGFKVERMGTHLQSIVPDSDFWKSSKEAKKVDVLTGSAIELKNLYLSRSVDFDLFPLLIFLGEMTRVTNRHVPIWVDGKAGSERLLVEPAETLIFPEALMGREYYTDMGFEEVKEAGVINGNIKMRMTRAQFRDRMVRYIREQRQGYRHLMGLNWAERDFKIDWFGNDLKDAFDLFNLPGWCSHLITRIPRTGNSSRAKRAAQKVFQTPLLRRLIRANSLSISAKISPFEPGNMNNLPKK